ncbi:MAG: endonuclease/exonuclease/phosphatase family protein [Opitutales bacterium]|nr:endonuclease/exonuclease/phosphatase family protein [Opitutales bacterium]
MKPKLLFPTLILRLSLLLIISTASSYAENPPIKVMSFNIRNGLAKDGENAWPLRQAFVVETIRTFDPDLLGLQEVHRFQADYLIEQLHEYDFYGVARDDGKVKGEIVPVMVKRDRFEMIESGHYWLSETPEVIGSKGWDSALPRLASWTLIRDKQGNDKPFIFGNTHWDHRGQVARLESAKLIRKRIDSVLPEIPVIVTGDFNTHEKLDPYAELVTSTGSSGAPLLDTYRVIHPQVRDLEGTFSAFTGERARNRIDWILTSQDFVTLNASINYTQENGRYPSDHYPVDAVVRLK